MNLDPKHPAWSSAHLKLGPHEHGGGVHHLGEGLRAALHHLRQVVEPEGALVVPAHHQPNSLDTHNHQVPSTNSIKKALLWLQHYPIYVVAGSKSETNPKIKFTF